MISIKKTLVSEDLFEQEFVCDLSACKGACCVEGEAGAPLEEEEVKILENNYVDFFCLGRAAILDHQFPNRLKAERSNFRPYSAPVTRSHLLKEGLSETFVDYMSTWKNFVSDVA